MKYLHIVWHGIIKALTWLLVLPILFYQKCITPIHLRHAAFSQPARNMPGKPYGSMDPSRGWLWQYGVS